MDLQRNSYLISSSMKKYLFAAIASTMIQTINTVVDGVLMGQFIGTEAFSAINLCMPIVGIVVCLSQFFFVGATVCASIALGAREDKRASKIFTVSIVCVLAISIIMLLFGIFGLNFIASLVCREDALLVYVKSYLFIYFIGCPATMISTAMSAFVDVGGMPKLVTVSSVANMLTNIACDIIYIKVFNMDISGAALATITGSIVSLCIVLFILKIKGSPFKLIKVKDDFVPILKENLKYGIPVASVTLATVAYSYIISVSAQIFCGISGAFVVSVLNQLTVVCQAVSSGVSMSVSAIGGLLTGQKDYKGVNFLFKRGMLISILFATFLIVLSVVFIVPICSILGAKSPELIDYASHSLRIALMYILPITVVWGMPSVYAIAGQLSLIPIISISQPVITGLSLYLSAKLLGNDSMWVGFPIAGLLIFLILLLSTEIARRKSTEERCFFSLLLKPVEQYNIFDVSIPCDIDALRQSLFGISDFFKNHNIDDYLCMRVRLCSEELLINIIENTKFNKFADSINKSRIKYIDYKIVISDNNILAIIKDDGKQFDPIHSLKMGDGLKIVNSLCSDIDYKYTYGQNMTFLTWNY